MRKVLCTETLGYTIISARFLLSSGLCKLTWSITGWSSIHSPTKYGLLHNKSLLLRLFQFWSINNFSHHHPLESKLLHTLCCREGEILVLPRGLKLTVSVTSQQCSTKKNLLILKQKYCRRDLGPVIGKLSNQLDYQDGKKSFALNKTFPFLL